MSGSRLSWPRSSPLATGGKFGSKSPSLKNLPTSAPCKSAVQANTKGCPTTPWYFYSSASWLNLPDAASESPLAEWFDSEKNDEEHSIGQRAEGTPGPARKTNRQ